MSQGHKVQKHISVEGDRETGVSLHSIECPPSSRCTFWAAVSTGFHAMLSSCITAVCSKCYEGWALDRVHNSHRPLDRFQYVFTVL